MDFSTALQELKSGKAVTRAGWGDVSISGHYLPDQNQTETTDAETTDESPRLNHITSTNAQGNVAVWVPTIPDIMAEDWQVQQ